MTISLANERAVPIAAGFPLIAGVVGTLVGVPVVAVVFGGVVVTCGCFDPGPVLAGWGGETALVVVRPGIAGDKAPGCGAVPAVAACVMSPAFAVGGLAC